MLAAGQFQRYTAPTFGKTMRRPAFFVIDMLNDCFGHAELDRMRVALCSSINQLTALARTNGFPVIWVRQEFESDLSDAFWT
jgi:nicotinamidase-related amidase